MSLQDRLHHHVEVLAELIGERNSSRPTSLDATRTYVRRELEEMGYQVDEQPFATLDRQAINLQVVLPGARANKPTLVIGAHYDTARGTPGADDNASAVAILLEIARELSNHKARRGVRIVFYDCEEPPYFNTGDMGSRFHAVQLKQSGENVLGMICLESLGYFVKEANTINAVPRWLRWITRIFGQKFVVIVSDPKSIRFGWKFTWRFATSGVFPFIAAALPVRWVPEIALSDHRNYWEQNIPALMITDTALLRNPNYHTADDRIDTLDFKRMTRLCRQLQRTVRRMCN